MKKLLIISTMLLSMNSYAYNNIKGTEEVSFIGSQMGVNIEGKFKKSDISFDTKNVNVNLLITDIIMPSKDGYDLLQNEDWFNSKKYNKVSFNSEKISKITNNSYEAIGNITIKGKTQKIKIPFILDEKNKLVTGVMSFNRREYNVGDNSWKDLSVVADKIIIKFKFKIKE